MRDLSMRDQFALGVELEDQLVDSVFTAFGRIACFARLPNAPHEMDDLEIPEQDELSVRVHCQALARLRYMMADAMIKEKMIPCR